MKTHGKKKMYQRMLKELMKKGFINDVDGRMILRSQAKDSGMERDYCPQNMGKR